MAMRQRGDNTRPGQSIRPTYEDFQPQFELKEEPEAHIINVQLPGFLKEQVRIIFVHATGVIRVHGQRPLGNNRWKRFNQTFPLPQNCHESKIHGMFTNGVLTITLPKEVISKAAAAMPIQEPSTSKPITAAAQEGLPLSREGIIAGTKDDEAGVVPTMTSQNEQQRDEKRVIALTSPKPQKGKDEIAMGDEKAKAEPLAPPLILSKEKEMTGTGERSKFKEAAAVKTIDDDEVKKKSKRSGTVEQEIKPFIAANKKTENVDKWISNEDTQLLINVGAAVVVLVAFGAFGAYTTYNLWCSVKPNN